METGGHINELTHRYGVDDVDIFSAAERARFLPGGTPDVPIDRSLSFELLYRLNPTSTSG